MDKYTVNTNNEYRAKINTGDLILLAKSNGNFDYSIFYQVPVSIILIKTIQFIVYLRITNVAVVFLEH